MDDTRKGAAGTSDRDRQRRAVVAEAGSVSLAHHHAIVMMTIVLIQTSLLYGQN